MKTRFLKIALISLFGLILVTCQKEAPLSQNQMIFSTETETEINSLQLNSSSISGYLLDLIDNIETMVVKGLLSKGNANALISKIKNAIKSIDNGNINAARGQLNAFINEIEAFINNGLLTMEQGQTFINMAENGIILSDGSFIDPRDGYKYSVVLIGTQLWMAENLKTIKYNDGTTIPLVTDNTAWAALTTPGYCWYNNDAATYKATYGALYNWYAVGTGKLCPPGWHVPTDAEWTVLTDFLGGESVAGGKLIETGETGFTALPGGYRYGSGAFYPIGYNGHWWSSTELYTGGAWYRVVHYSTSDVYRNDASKTSGFSVRCVKDN